MKLFDIVLLLGAGQGILLALLLFTRPGNSRNNRLLGCLLGLLSFHLVLVGNDNPEFFLQNPHLSRITWSIPLLYGPLIYLLTCSLTNPRFRWKAMLLLYFLPFLFIVSLLTPYYVLPAQEKIAYLSDWERVLAEDFGWMNQFTNGVHVVFFGLSLWRLRLYVKRLHALYSSEQHMRLLWLKNMLIGLFYILSFSVLVFYARKYGWPLLGSVYPYHFLGVVMLLYWIGYKALAQPQLFQADPMLEALQTPYAAEDRNKAKPVVLPQVEEAMVEQALRIQKAVEDDKLYLDPELDLIKLSQHLGLPRYQVSAVLNGVVQKNFYDFINDYRVDAFKQLAGSAAYSHYTLLALAHEAGFNSKSTFNAVFKKKTGQTPSQYYQKLGAKASAVV